MVMMTVPAVTSNSCLHAISQHNIDQSSRVPKMKSWVEKAVSAFGKIDIVFANAGASGTTRIGDTTLDAFNAIIETNLTSVFFTVQAAASHMNDGGAVILNGSVHAVMGWPYFSAYAATKGAVRSMTHVMVSELAGRRIRVNQVTPGATKTPLWSRLVPDAEQMGALETCDDDPSQPSRGSGRTGRR
jgi:NAD(P)-dependent dehydrogenase (short-subunit alcohol dehydrogenase family)